MNTNIHFWSYLAQFLVEWEIFQAKIVEKIKTHIMCSITLFFSRKSYRLWHNVEKYGEARQARDGSIIRRMISTCWTTKATDIQSEYVTCMTSPLQQWLHERPSMLRYVCIAFLFVICSQGKLKMT